MGLYSDESDRLLILISEIGLAITELESDLQEARRQRRELQNTLDRELERRIADIEMGVHGEPE